MSTYLLTWNPKRSPNPDLLKAAANFQRHRRAVQGRWSCGNNKHIEIGERAFLLRQGPVHPGIVASGWVTKRSFSAPSWEESKRKRGAKALYVDVEWDDLVMPQKGLPRARLLNGLLPATLLKSAASGVAVPTQLVSKLERSWSRHLKQPLKPSRLAVEILSASEGEPIEHRVYRRKRDQKLRRAALDAAKNICTVCRTDYSRVLDGRGVRVLQVHHKKQLGYNDKPRLTKATDLAVVCANCHALIHLDTKRALTINALRRMLRVRRA